MENIKGQGAQTGAAESLSAPMTMLELSKFREAELMAEQYLSTHEEDGRAYLILLAAKAKLKNLHSYKKGGVIDPISEESLLLLMKHHELLANVLRYADHKTAERTLGYMQGYLDEVMRVYAYLRLFPEQGENLAELFNTVLNPLFSSDRGEYAALCYRMGAYLLSIEVYDEAKEFLENAKENGARVSDCLLGIFFAELRVSGEEQFIQCDRFSNEMPEYINLLIALGDDKEMLTHISSLVTKNAQAREEMETLHAKARFESRFKSYRKKDATPMRTLGTVLFWIMTAFSFVYFLFFYKWGEVWDVFVDITPFGRYNVFEKSRVSLITSTVILVIEQLLFLCTLFFNDGADRMAVTLRKYVFWIAVHSIASFGVWYLMYAYAQWFYTWDGFMTVLASLVLALVACAALLFTCVGVGMGKPFFDKRLISLVGQAWQRAFHREYLAILFLSMGIYVFRAVLAGQTMRFLELIVGAFFLIFGLVHFFGSLKGRFGAILKFGTKEGDLPSHERDEILKNERVMGITYLLLAIGLYLFFTIIQIRLGWTVGLVGAIAASSLIHIFLGYRR